MAAVLSGGPDDAVLPDPIRVSVSKLLARSGATPVCMHGPESVAPTAPMTGKEFTGSSRIECVTGTHIHTHPAPISVDRRSTKAVLPRTTRASLDPGTWGARSRR